MPISLESETKNELFLSKSIDIRTMLTDAVGHVLVSCMIASVWLIPSHCDIVHDCVLCVEVGLLQDMTLI